MISSSLRKLILERDNHTCVYCGNKATAVDHIIPQSVGGSDKHKNLVASCKLCNSIAHSNVFKNFEEKKRWILDRVNKRKTKISKLKRDKVFRSGGNTSEGVPLVLSRAITESVKRINNSRGAKALGIRTTKTDFYSNLAPHVRVIEKRISHFIRKQTRTKRKPKAALTTEAKEVTNE